MRWIAAVVLFLVTATAAVAQFDSATVLGTVTDQSGAVVTHSQVKLHNSATGLEQSTVSGDQGQFQFANVPVGSYKLEITAQGFQTVVAAFELTVGAHQRVDVKLNVASVAASVQATAEAAQLETDSSEHSQVVAAREIAELPLNGRNYSQLVALSTGVVPSPLAQSSSYLARDGSFNINGLRSTYSNYLLDGSDNNFYGTSNQGFSNQVVQLPPDSVAEFRVVTNNQSAEFGRSGGATINVVTRYGTNQWHGRAWEFVRNTAFNAEGFFKPDVGGKPALHRNQFGGNFGGPIKKDKLFFFIDYEGYRQTESFTDQAAIPSLAERGLSSTGASLGYYQIDNTDSGAPMGSILPVNNPCNYNVGQNPCTSTTYLTYGLGGYLGGATYLNGQVPASAVIPFAKALLSYLPNPTRNATSTNFNNYVVLHPESVNKDKGDAKIDWTPKDNLRLFLRYSQARFNAFDPGTIPGVAGSDGDGNVRAPLKQIVAGATWTLSPVSVLEARFGFSTMEAGKTPVLAGQNTMTGGLSLPGVPTDPEWTGGVTYQYFLDGGFTNLGRQMTNPQHQNPSLWNPKVNYSRLIRNHSLKTGFEYTMLHVAQEDLHPVLGANAYTAQISGTCYYKGCYGFYGTQTAETYRMFDYADFLFGYQAQMGISSPTISNLRNWGLAGYVQDDWKLSRKLSVNLGLRYEYNTPIYEADNKLANYDPSTQAMVTASSSDRFTVNPNKADFGPRVGASYALDQKTVLRGGYGISYAHWNRVGSNYLTMNPPFGIVAQRVVYPSIPTYSNTQSGFPTSFFSATGYSKTEAVAQYMPKDSPDTQVWNWFFSVQRDLGRNWMVELGYVGNHGLNEVIVNDINQATSGGTSTLQSRVPVTAYGTIAGILPWATSDYNGMQLKVEKRFSQGLYILESFTWSKAIDYAAQALDGGGNCSNCGNSIPSVQNIYNWQADRGISAYNHPFINNTTAVWTLPVGKGQKYLSNIGTVANNVVGGWQMTGIFQARSGNPLTFAYSPNTYQQVSALITVDGRNAYRPNQTGPAVASDKSYLQYFNVGSFASPATDGTATPFGNSPRNAARGYAYFDVDMGLTKQFAITEKSHFEFRAEAFNLFNKTNFSDPNTVVPNLGKALTTSTAGTFGEITSSLSARVLQMAAKIVF
ncbi:MAG: TonB-dependent receptor [Terracidiphilus sp.]|nr:TonB-dependent receptor [Terracidiphilus sp.]